MSERLSGGCFCGAIRYTAEATETKHYLCHCADCRRYNGSAHHAAIVVAANELKVDGTPAVSTVTADSGRSIARHFCGSCGGHLFTSPWPDVTRYSVKAGTLDEGVPFRPDAEIWTKSRVAWALPLPDAEQFSEGFTRPISIGARKG